MISCQEAALLSAKKSIDTLSISETLKFKLHRKICKVCQDYHNQNQLLDDLISKTLQEKANSSIELSAEAKEVILKALNKS